MYEVNANSMSCTFSDERDAINAFLMSLAMIEDINSAELYQKIEFDINNRSDNTYAHNYFMSICKY